MDHLLEIRHIAIQLVNLRHVRRKVLVCSAPHRKITPRKRESQNKALGFGGLPSHFVTILSRAMTKLSAWSAML